VSRSRADLFFSAALVAFFAWVAWEARQWDFRAQLFPMAVALPLLVLAIAQFAASAWRTVVMPREAPGEHADAAAAGTFRRGAAIGAWILGFTAAIWLLGFEIGSALAAFAFLRFAAAEAWKTALVYAAATYVCLAAGFDYALEITFPQGVVQSTVLAVTGGG
jgi:hypothetical protein